MSEISLDQVREFYEWLYNDSIPDSITVGDNHQPKLTKKQAFTVIWFLQEHLQVLPSRFEKCDNCDSLFNSWEEGFVDGDKACFYCDSCKHKANLEGK